MKVLLVGNGGREHAIAENICKNKDAQLFAYMSALNPGIARLCKRSKGEFGIGDIHNPEEVSKFAREKKIELAFASPDAVLEAGVSDALLSAGIPCASPIRDAARLEWDKGFARSLMKKYGIPGCPKFGIFKNADEAAKFIDELGEVAVKPAGLTGGKGVKVMGYQLKDGEEAKRYAKEVLERNIGKLGEVVIEERLIGEEFTLQAFVDGKNVVGMPAVQDHKLSGEGEVGVNTGGMGSYTDAGYFLPFMKEEEYRDAFSIMREVISAFEKETGKQFKGVLYGQFILTAAGPKVVEFNARFGDPEAMNVLPILESDFLNILQKIERGNLSERDVKFAPNATVCKYIVPEGYPEAGKKGELLEVDERGISETGAKLFFASVSEKEGKIYTGSSRSIGLVGIAESIYEAEKIAESAAKFVRGPVWHRRDIGTRELVERKIKRMEEIRAGKWKGGK